MTPQIDVNRAKINCTKENVCEYWLKLTRELHDLSDSEMMLAAKFLEKRIELQEKINDDELINDFLQSTKVRAGIKEAANISSMAVFQNMMTALRKKGFFIEGDKINKVFIPNIKRDSKYFKIEFLLKIDG